MAKIAGVRTWSLLLLCLAALPWACADPADPGDREPSLPGVPVGDWSPRACLCRRTETPPVIDGRLDDEAWGRAAVTEEFADISGGDAPAPRHRTTARLLWDEKHLYIAAEIEEPHVWGKLTERDSVIFHDNDFEVFLDPDGDTHLYYEIEINPLGTVWDLMLVKPYRDGGPPVNAWDVRGLRSAIHVDGTLNDPSDTDRGWSVEMAIPFRVMKECAGRRCPPQPGDRWRLNMSRVQWRTEVRDGAYVKSVDPTSGKPWPEDNWVWSPQGLVNMHYPERWGFLEFAGSSGEPRSPRPIAPAERAAADLYRVHYAEKARFDRTGSYSDRASELGIAGIEGLRLEAGPWGYRATLPVEGGRSLSIREDGRLVRSDGDR